MPIREPNFFVLGAPKCGTTSIAGYLSDHRDIFVSDPKEPNYLARSLSVPGGFLSRQAWHTDDEQWLRLFAAAAPGVKAVGEGSTRYLRCRPALIQIKNRFPHARLIVCLRNPADLAESWHSQKLWEGQENQHDFESAWRLQAARAAGEAPLPPGLEEYDALEYARVASVGSQLEIVLKMFALEQVLTVFLDDLKAAPRECYLRLLEFLKVPDDQRKEFPRANTRRRRRWWPPREFVRSIRDSLIGGDGPSRQVPASATFRAELREHFRDEVMLLSELTGRDLSIWTRN